MPSWMEPGGMDWSDWKTERGAQVQYLYERDDEIERLGYKLEDLDYELDSIYGDRKIIDRGEDSDLLAEFASLEIERRAKLEEQRRKKEEAKLLKQERETVIEFEGANELTLQLKEITSLIREKKIPINKDLPMGWRVAGYYHPNEGKKMGVLRSPEIFAFHYQQSKGLNDEYVHEYVDVRLDLNDDEKYSIRVNDFRQAVEDPTANERNKRRKDKHIELKLGKDGRAYYHAVGESTEDRTWGYRMWEDRITNERFTQNHFDYAKGIVNSLAADLKTVVPPTQ